jgi:hypothetical protein
VLSAITICVQGKTLFGGWTRAVLHFAPPDTAGATTVASRAPISGPDAALMRASLVCCHAERTPGGRVLHFAPHV